MTKRICLDLGMYIMFSVVKKFIHNENCQTSPEKEELNETHTSFYKFGGI